MRNRFSPALKATAPRTVINGTADHSAADGMVKVVLADPPPGVPETWECADTDTAAKEIRAHVVRVLGVPVEEIVVSLTTVMPVPAVGADVTVKLRYGTRGWK